MIYRLSPPLFSSQKSKTKTKIKTAIKFKNKYDKYKRDKEEIEFSPFDGYMYVIQVNMNLNLI
jgi:hypothetical protein